MYLYITTLRTGKKQSNTKKKSQNMKLEQRMEKQLLRARPMARLFPHTDLHIFTKRCL